MNFRVARVACALALASCAVEAGPAGQDTAVQERRITRTAAPGRGPLPPAASPAGSWPSFRGPHASGVAEGQRLPDRWDGETKQNVLWRTPVPGLAHSSPIVWGDTVFVTSAISSRKGATFKPGLYGDGDASDDRSVHKWVVYAIDKRTGRIRWERVAREGAPRNKRHIKSTYASAHRSPTDASSLRGSDLKVCTRST